MDGDRVLIVSTHSLFWEGIVRLLGDRVEVVGTATDWDEARVLIQQRRPHTVIVDHESTELQDIDLTPLLWPETETLKVIYVTLAGNEIIVHERRRISSVTEDDLLGALETTTEMEPGRGRPAEQAVPPGGRPPSQFSGQRKGGGNMRKLAIPVLLTLVISIPLALFFFRTSTVGVLASQQGQAVDFLLRLEFSVAAVILVLCMVFLLYSVFAFRRAPGDLEDARPVEGSMPLEVSWTVVPLLIVLGLGFYGSGVLFDITKSPQPESELVVDVTGFQWAWKFEYPELGITSSELVLPVNQPVLFRLHATDVIHSFWVPEFRIKLDAIPGIENRLRVKPTKVGQYKVRCAELCGTGHAYMLANVEVVEEAAFKEWVAHELEAVEAVSGRGREWAEQFGCLSCHSTDGSTLVGPTWKGLYQSERRLQDGTTVIADEEYLRNSILHPELQIVEGFPDVMPKNFKDLLSEKQVQDLIEYIQSID